MYAANVQIVEVVHVVHVVHALCVKLAHVQAIMWLKAPVMWCWQVGARLQILVHHFLGKMVYENQ